MIRTDGAGVDVLKHAAWDCAPPRQTRSWVIAPTGRTEWVRERAARANGLSLICSLQGLDWHGPSTQDVWSSMAALSEILNRHTIWQSWSFPADTKAVIVGHSNGGQGTWYVTARYPDKILAGQSYTDFPFVCLTLLSSQRYLLPRMLSLRRTYRGFNRGVYYLGP